MLILMVGVSLAMGAQTMSQDSLVEIQKNHNPKLTSLIAPTVLVGIGVVGIHSHWLQARDADLRKEILKNSRIGTIYDDVSQHVPMAAVYGLNMLGVKSTHTLGQQAVLGGMSALTMGVLVNSMKYGIKKMRPDGSSRNSFPSGHTATAFMGAEMLYQEYKDTSPWIWIAGYTMATGTGFLRMYNNRHWLTDVIAGAGIGIFSVKLSYWLYPKIYTEKRNRKGVFVAPLYDGKNIGVASQITF
jgi:membrane-associated phospholipid phosphatase